MLVWSLQLCKYKNNAALSTQFSSQGSASLSSELLRSSLNSPAEGSQEAQQLWQLGLRPVTILSPRIFERDEEPNSPQLRNNYLQIPKDFLP